MEMLSKYCAKCGEYKALSEFNKHKGNKDGLQYTCKACKKAVSAEYYTRTREEQAEKGKRYRTANIEKVRARSRKYYQENKERILARQNNEHTKAYFKGYYLKHKDEICSRAAAWRKDNPEYAKAISKRWRKNHPDSHRDSTRAHATKQRDTLGDSYIKQILNNRKKGVNRIHNIPAVLIELKRLELLIKRRIKDEDSNRVT